MCRSLTDPAPTPTAQSVKLSSSQAALAGASNELFKRILELRGRTNPCSLGVSLRLPALVRSPALDRAAEAHAIEMAELGYLAHVDATGKSPRARVQAALAGAHVAGEVIAAGHSTAQQVVQAWAQSADHCQIIVSEAYGQLGVAAATSKAGKVCVHPG
ncbi:MAG: CAP domain-containing protein [Polyangiaceae bacterium]|nr:CAP domain-containing protein [Polyangiaceae bacterium]